MWDIHPDFPVAAHLNVVPWWYWWTGHPSFWLDLWLSVKLLVWISIYFDCILANQSICYCLLGRVPGLCKIKNELLWKEKIDPRKININCWCSLLSTFSTTMMWNLWLISGAFSLGGDYSSNVSQLSLSGLPCIFFLLPLCFIT